MVLENKPSSGSDCVLEVIIRVIGSKLASCPSVNGQVVKDLLSAGLVKGGGNWVVPREFSSRPKMDEGFLCFLLLARRNFG